jgi:hypothetical protein
MIDDIDERLAVAADSAALELVEDRDATVDVFGDEGLFDGRCARFVRISGDISGEALFRWTSAQNLHPFRGDEWPKISGDFRVLFESFVAVVKALAPIVAPPQGEKGVVIFPGAPKVDVEDTVFRKYGRSGEKTHHGLAEGTPNTTAGLTITPNAPAPAAAPIADVEEPKRPPIVIGRDALTRFEKGAPPSQAEFMAMSPEERRPYAALFGMPGVEAVMQETPGAAPPAEDLAPMSIETEVKGEKISGTVSVGRTKRGK